jgi:hypothetical protein
MSTLQPFEAFKPVYITRLLDLGRRYLVSQTYSRAQKAEMSDPAAPVPLLLSDYAALGEAKLHVNAVKKDPYAAIIDLHLDGHRKKIEEMLRDNSRYLLFFAVVRSSKALEAHINKHYKEKLKRYVDQKTNWRIAHDAVVRPSIQLSFGELFIILQHHSQRIRIKFREIEE